MKFLSEQVRLAGFTFGLWFAPYITHVGTNIAQAHPDWMVRDATTGEPLFRDLSNVGARYVIDFSIPEALEWLRETLSTIVREWHVGYLKLDGPALGHYRGGVLRDRNMTLVQMVRKSLEAIREACGEDVLIEGGGGGGGGGKASTDPPSGSSTRSGPCRTPPRTGMRRRRAALH